MTVDECVLLPSDDIRKRWRMADGMNGVKDGEGGGPGAADSLWTLGERLGAEEVKF